MKIPNLLENDESLHKTKGKNRKPKSSGKRRRNRENRENELLNQFNVEASELDEASDRKKKGNILRNKKRKNEKIVEAAICEIDEQYNEADNSVHAKNGAKVNEKKKSKSKKKRRKNAEINEVDELYNDVEDGSNQPKGKPKRARKMKKKNHLSQDNGDLLEKRGDAEQDDVYQISSGEEDCSRGMKKWITEYHQSRPGVKILQQRIDDFIVAQEAQEEQARKEREAQMAEDGWTVVVHHKGRKKTTDSESGIAVGSVAQAAVINKMAKKKSKDVGLDFYRFQKREAQRNEIMMLQSNFEQDKKRIQQMRAERKFRPY